VEVELIFDEDWVCSDCDAGGRGLLPWPCFIVKGWGWGVGEWLRHARQRWNEARQTPVVDEQQDNGSSVYSL
jgi:hypothetical protein